MPSCHFDDYAWERLCPLSIPGGCTDMCMRFEATMDTPGARELWEKHWDILDGKTE